MELWLQNVVKIEPRRAQATACAMQHSVVPEFEAWVCGQLGVPRHSPKDHAIPPCCPKGDKG